MANISAPSVSLLSDQPASHLCHDDDTDDDDENDDRGSDDDEDDQWNGRFETLSPRRLGKTSNDVHYAWHISFWLEVHEDVVENRSHSVFLTRKSRGGRSAIGWQAAASTCQSITDRPSHDFRLRKMLWIISLTSATRVKIQLVLYLFIKLFKQNVLMNNVLTCPFINNLLKAC